MADYAIVIKACSKIVCHALSRLKHRQCYGYCFQALLGYLLSIYTYFFMLGRLYWVIYCLFIPNLFLLGPLRNVNFTGNLTQAKEAISIFEHIFHGYSNRQLHFRHINIAHIVSWTSNYEL